MPEPTFQPGETLTIRRAANGFIVHPDYDRRDPSRGDTLVFNHLGAGLLAFLAQHFETEEDRERRLAQEKASLELTVEINRAALRAGFPAIDPTYATAGVQAHSCALHAEDGRTPCHKWCGNPGCAK